jgi:hypothetical protein
MGSVCDVTCSLHAVLSAVRPDTSAAGERQRVLNCGGTCRRGRRHRPQGRPSRRQSALSPARTLCAEGRLRAVTAPARVRSAAGTRGAAGKHWSQGHLGGSCCAGNVPLYLCYALDRRHGLQVDRHNLRRVLRSAQSKQVLHTEHSITLLSVPKAMTTCWPGRRAGRASGSAPEHRPSVSVAVATSQCLLLPQTLCSARHTSAQN